MSNQDEFAKKLTAYLDAGTAELKAGTAYKLQLARAQALGRLDPQHARSIGLSPAMAGAGASMSRGSSGGGRGLRPRVILWLGILLIVAGSLGYQQWQVYQQAYQQASDLAETDAAILSSDLPIDAYLDRGFQNWLKHDTDD